MRRRSIHPNMFRTEEFMLLSTEGKNLIVALGTYSDYADRFRPDVPAMQAYFKTWFSIDAWHELLTAGLVTLDGAMATINFAYGFARKRISRWEAIRSFIFERDGFACTYCGIDESLHCDHVVPKSKGGDESPNNLTTACKSCNLSKGDKLLSEWRS